MLPPRIGAVLQHAAREVADRMRGRLELARPPRPDRAEQAGDQALPRHAGAVPVPPGRTQPRPVWRVDPPRAAARIQQHPDRARSLLGRSISDSQGAGLYRARPNDAGVAAVHEREPDADVRVRVRLGRLDLLALPGGHHHPKPRLPRESISLCHSYFASSVY